MGVTRVVRVREMWSRGVGGLWHHPGHSNPQPIRGLRGGEEPIRGLGWGRGQLGSPISISGWKFKSVPPTKWRWSIDKEIVIHAVSYWMLNWSKIFILDIQNLLSFVYLRMKWCVKYFDWNISKNPEGLKSPVAISHFGETWILYLTESGFWLVKSRSHCLLIGWKSHHNSGSGAWQSSGDKHQMSENARLVWRLIAEQFNANVRHCFTTRQNKKI